MAISHKDHNHPNTPAARAACRKAGTAGPKIETNIGRVSREYAEASGLVKPAKMTVVPRRKGDGGVVKGMTMTQPTADNGPLKKAGSLIKDLGDLVDVPHALAVAVRRAWTQEYPVMVGHEFTWDERRIVVHAPLASISLVWDSRGRTAVFVRHADSSVTFKVANIDQGFYVSMTPDAWTPENNLRKVGTRVEE